MSDKVYMKNNKSKLYLIGIVVSILAGFLSLFLIKGNETGVAPLITIFFTGFAGGASLTAYVSDWRNTKNNKM